MKKWDSKDKYNYLDDGLKKVWCGREYTNAHTKAPGGSEPGLIEQRPLKQDVGRQREHTAR